MRFSARGSPESDAFQRVRISAKLFPRLSDRDGRGEIVRATELPEPFPETHETPFASPRGSRGGCANFTAFAACTRCQRPEPFENFQTTAILALIAPADRWRLTNSRAAATPPSALARFPCCCFERAARCARREGCPRPRARQREEKKLSTRTRRTVFGPTITLLPCGALIVDDDDAQFQVSAPMIREPARIARGRTITRVLATGIIPNDVGHHLCSTSLVTIAAGR